MLRTPTSLLLSTSHHTALTTTICLNAVPQRWKHSASKHRAKKREKKRKLRRLGYTTFTSSGQPIATTEDKAEKRKSKAREEQEEEENEKVFKIPQGNSPNNLNPNTVRDNLQEILKSPVRTPIGTPELRSSEQLRKQDKAQHKPQQKQQPEPTRRELDLDEDEVPTTSQAEEMKKIVFKDRKDYINYQIQVTKDRVQNKEKMSAHRFATLFKEKTLTEEEAKELFDLAREAKVKDTVMYNGYINYFAKRGKVDKALDVIDSMRTDKVKPDTATYNIYIDLFCRLGQFHEAIAIFESLRPKRLEPNKYTFNTLISHFARSKQTDLALEFYQKMEQMGAVADAAVHNTVIKLFCDSNQYQQAYTIFKHLKSERSDVDPDVITYSILIDRLVKDGKFGDARDLLDEMKNSGIKPDANLYSSIIYELGKAGKADSVSEAYDEMIEDGVKPNANVYNSLLDAFTRNGKEDKAEAVRAEIKSKNISTNSSFLAKYDQYAKNGEIEKGLDVIKQMKANRMMPSEKVYITLYKTLGTTAKLSQEERERHTLTILVLMKDDGLQPYMIFEDMIATNMSSDVAKAYTAQDFDFFLGLFKRTGYKLDSFFVDAFAETLVRKGLRKAAFAFVNMLVELGKRENDVRYYSETVFAVLVRAFTAADEYNEVLKVFQLWATAGVRIVETTVVPVLVKLTLQGMKEQGKAIMMIAQRHGANGKMVLQGLDHILAPTTHKERAEREAQWLKEHFQHPGQLHIQQMYQLQQAQKAALKAARGRDAEAQKRSTKKGLVEAEGEEDAYEEEWVEEEEEQEERSRQPQQRERERERAVQTKGKVGSRVKTRQLEEEDEAEEEEMPKEPLMERLGVKKGNASGAQPSKSEGLISRLQGGIGHRLAQSAARVGLGSAAQPPKSAPKKQAKPQKEIEEDDEDLLNEDSFEWYQKVKNERKKASRR